MPPLSSPRTRSLRRASVLLLPLTAAVLLCLVPACSGFPGHNRCPVDCARQRRANCPVGSSFCGPCFHLFEQNEEGRCVLRRHKQVRVMPNTDLDEEIDFLQSVITKQVVKQHKDESKHPVAEPLKTSGRKTEASKAPQRSQSRLLSGGQRAATTAPPPAVSGPPNPPTPQPVITGRAGHIAVPAPSNDKILVLIISLCVVVGSVAIILATVCVVKLQRDSRLAEKVDYPAFKGADPLAPAPNGTSMGDNTLAKSAQMFHYQHQKQQMISLGNHKSEQKVHDADVTSDEEDVGGDFTVYECPGLAPTGEMEVKNPLFDDSNIPYQENPK